MRCWLIYVRLVAIFELFTGAPQAFLRLGSRKTGDCLCNTLRYNCFWSLHSGKPVRMVIEPASADYGICLPR